MVGDTAPGQLAAPRVDVEHRLADRADRRRRSPPRPVDAGDDEGTPSAVANTTIVATSISNVTSRTGLRPTWSDNYKVSSDMSTDEA